MLMPHPGQSIAPCLVSSQDEPALRAGAARGILDKTCARRSARRQVGSEEWSF
jgi:hypothetical protein